MGPDTNEEALLRSVALQNSKSIFLARQKAERELELRTEELAQSLAMMRATLESTTDGILVTDSDWKVTGFNQKFLVMWGVSEEILASRLHLKLIEVSAGRFKKPEAFRERIEEIYASSPPETFDLLELADGRVFERFSMIQSVHDRNVGRVWTFRDVTERKRADEALREQREWFEVTLSSIGDAVITTDTQGKVTFLNPVAEAMTGWKAREAFGQPLDVVFIIVHEETREPAVNPIHTVLRDGVTVGLANHTVLIGRQGHETAIEDSAAPIRDACGKMSGAVMVFHDVTERRRSEEALRTSEEKLRATFNQAAVGMAIASLEGRFERVNPRLVEITGYSEEDLCARTFIDLTHPDDLAATRSYVRRLIAGEIHFYAIEKRYLRKDGSVIWSHTTVTLLKDSAGRAERFVGVVEDITQRKQAEDALRDETRILELLNKTGTSIASQLDLQSLVQTVTDAATQLSGAKFGAFFYNVITPEGESLVLYTLSGAPREAFEKFGLPRNNAVFNPTFRGEGVLRSPDITKDPRYGTMPPHHGMPIGHLPVRSYLAVPVISRSGKVLGWLFFGHPEPDVFTERSERLIIGVAAQAAIAIDHAQLYEGAQKEIAERKLAEEALAQRVRLTALRAGVSAVIATAGDLQSVLQSCAELLVKHLDAAFARIWTLNPGTNVLELKASAGIYTHLDGPHGRVKMGVFKIGRIAESGTPHVTNDVQHDPNVSDLEWARKEGMVGFAGYPLTVGDRVVGVVAMFARNPFADEVLKELSLIADGLAQWIQRKQAEQALQEAQEKLSRHAEDLEKQVAERTGTLRETIGELEAFSYSISHDMRAPLRAMQSFAQILVDDCGDQVSPIGREYIRRITTAAERMDQLIQDVLTYSQVARTELTLEVVDVRALLCGILESYPMFQTPVTEIEMIGHFPPVLGNEAALTQCISNLLGNAVKFVAPGVSPQVRIWTEEMESKVRIFFRDNGVGIEKEAHQTIFAIFQRVTQKYEGTGIGLAIVKKGVERMGGSVGLASTPGQGSTFWLELQRPNPPKR